MAQFAIVVLVVFLILYLGAIFRRGGRGIVAKRGMSVGADLGMLAATPRVRVRSVIREGPDRVRLVLVPEPGLADRPELTALSDLDLVVRLGEGEFGFDLLHEWKRSESSIAIVMPAESRIVRLRSVDSLQPLTLRRLDD